MLYVNNSTIFTTSTTTTTTTHTTIDSFKITLAWLQNNGLSADPAKTKLMVFSKFCQPNLTSGKIWGT